MHNESLSEAADAQPLFDATVARDGPFFGHLLMSVSRNWRHVLVARLAQLGLTDATWAPLFHLHAAGRVLSLKQLAHRVGLDSSTLVRVVDLLEQRGLLQRQTDPQDRRSKALVLTAKGAEVVDDVRSKLHCVEAQLLQGMDAQTIAALQMGMQQLNARLAAIQLQDREQA